MYRKLKETITDELMEDDQDEPQEGDEIEDQYENKKIKEQAQDAETKFVGESKLEDPSKEELKVTEKKDLTEDDPNETQEGLEIEGQAESKKTQGHGEDAEAKNLDDSKLEDHSKEELKVTEKEELTEDDLEGAGRCSGTGQYRNWPPFHQLPRATLTCR